MHNTWKGPLCNLQETQAHISLHIPTGWAVFVCVEAVWPKVSLPNHTSTGQAWSSMVKQYCAHSFTRNRQLPFLNQRTGENDRRKYFVINLHERMLPTNPQPPDHQWDAANRANKAERVYVSQQRMLRSNCMHMLIWTFAVGMWHKISHCASNDTCLFCL